MFRSSCLSIARRAQALCRAPGRTPTIADAPGSAPSLLPSHPNLPPTSHAARQARGFHASPVTNFIYKTFDDVEAEGNVKKAETGTWESRRYVLRKDGMGFSFHHTVLYAGSETYIWYKNHVEAVFIFAGNGEIEVVNDKADKGKGKVYKLYPGVLYGLNGAEKHYLRAGTEDLHVACAFNPPVDGAEDHNEEGVYPVIDDDGVHWDYNKKE